MNQLVYGSQEYGRERTNHGEGQPRKRERERDRSGRVQREGVRREKREKRYRVDMQKFEITRYAKLSGINMCLEVR